MLVVKDVAKRVWGLSFHPYIEGVTVGKFGLIQAMLGKQGDACFSTRESTGIELGGRIGGGQTWVSYSAGRCSNLC